METLSLYEIKNQYGWIAETDYFKELEKDAIENLESEDEKIQSLNENVIKCYVFKIYTDVKVQTFINTILFWQMDRHLTHQAINQIKLLNPVGLTVECTKRILINPECMDFFNKLMIVSSSMDRNPEEVISSISFLGHLDLLLYMRKEVIDLNIKKVLKASAAGGRLNIIDYFLKECENYFEEIIIQAILNSKINVIEYFDQKEYDLNNVDFFETSMMNNNLDMIKLLYSKIKNYNPTRELYFLDNFHKEKFEWYFKTVLPLDRELYDLIMMITQFENLDFYKSMGFEPNLNTLLFLFEENEYSDYSFLLPVFEKYPELIIPEIYNRILYSCKDIEVLKKFESNGMT